MPRPNSKKDLEELRRAILLRRKTDKPWLAICAGTGCLALGARNVIGAFKEELKKWGLEKEIEIKDTGCRGFCEKGTNVAIYPEGIYYLQVQPSDVPEIVEKTLIEKKIVKRLLYTDPLTAEKAIHEREIPFYKHQMRHLIGNNIKIDPKNIEDYIALGGYSALAKVLSEMTPEEVIEEIKRANLRGRGGGGFPAGIKWESTRNAAGEPKYVIVNCDEGDPGAFMDRALMESNPHCVLEGLIIGAYAIGSHKGFIYIRLEYPLALQNTNIALDQAREYGLLGKNILGSDFDFDVKVYRGAGAFVSGESTALMRAIEGKVGEPRPKYVHTSESGVWNKPTNLNNVETWANVPLIIDKGADWFSYIGTEGSKGTKIFSLVGQVNNTGLVEVPMGITLRDIIYKIGGGAPPGKKIKGVQTGGPSGGIIPEQYLDSPVDFDELTKLGSMMGSGGMIVIDDDTCVVDLVRYFVDFLCDESCGKCLPCREGLKRMREILDDIVCGKGKEGDIEQLERIANVMKDTSLCALGKTAVNPVLSTIRYFRDEYEAHIKGKKCPALACKALISYYIEPERCIACLRCFKNCPAGAIDGDKRRIHQIDQSKCITCGICLDVCPPKAGAVTRISGKPVPPPLPEAERFIEKGEELSEEDQF
ncbi:MAG: NADH-quinone oxidoreductase subunit NuoF [Candidatus Methanolliviera hydrocarbonicum]|uniref:NADH-quinone oxidoreductase subunit NuoF n=1 Tax=Candidatus Methanolliviera hydrocarbonicum TaxID=2491085 RepID=A0A520KUV2_9EURY|nr:MAG: NADH-quinone oxidoreductase subunit NuoF [Candidatus Methanolliviera hydrocarbonicum]